MKDRDAPTKNKSVWNRICPMSVQYAELKIAEVQEQNTEFQKVILSEFQQLKNVLTAMQIQQKQYLEEFAQLCREIFLQYEELRNQAMAIHEQMETLFEKQVESAQAVQSISLLNKDYLKKLHEDLNEIKSGDIFHRIEFVQGKQVFLETMLQRNLLNEEEQKRSVEYQFITRMRSLFPVRQVEHKNGFVRIGKTNDGGYLMLDDFKERKIAYSIGIADDVSWDKDIAAQGLNVYLYDHTIQDIPEHLSQFHFFHTGLGGYSSIDHPELKTLAEMMSENGHLDERGMILKIDIEGAEWDFLNAVEEKLLTHFSQIVFEFHGLIFPENEKKIKTAMDKLNKTHQLVHLHPNNYGSYLLLGGKVLPELIEGTYLLRGEYTFSKGKQTFPAKQDEANCIYLPDIYLGGWDT